MTGATATDTRLVILDAALRCFRSQGVRKTTIVDVGRAAGVSRSTVYEYFPDKRAVVDAASEHALQLFYRAMARAMDHGASLEDKLGRAAVAVTRARRFVGARHSPTPPRSPCCSTGTPRRCCRSAASS